MVWPTSQTQSAPFSSGPNALVQSFETAMPRTSCDSEDFWLSHVVVSVECLAIYSEYQSILSRSFVRSQSAIALARAEPLPLYLVSWFLRVTGAPSTAEPCTSSGSVGRSTPDRVELEKRVLVEAAAQADLSKHLERHKALSRESLRSRDETLCRFVRS